MIQIRWRELGLEDVLFISILVIAVLGGVVGFVLFVLDFMGVKFG